MSRWGDWSKTLAHVAMSVNQDGPGFKFGAATVSSFMLVFSRCLVSGQSARQAQGTPKEEFARTAAAQTVFREWGAFLTSYGIVNTVNGGLGRLSQSVFNLHPQQVGKLNVGQGLGQMVGILLGTVRDVAAPPRVLTGETRMVAGPGGIRGQRFLQAVANTLAKGEIAGLSPEAVAQVGLRKWLDFGPIVLGTGIGVAISGWALERLALIKGPQLVAFMTKSPGQPSSSSGSVAEVAANHPPLQLASGRAVFPAGSTRLPEGMPARVGPYPVVRIAPSPFAMGYK